jgi:hypothetical protein
VGRRNSLVRRYAARHSGRYDSAEREIIVGETCAQRESECVAMLAEWSHDDPSSEALQRVARAASRNREVNLSLVGSLSPLFGDDPQDADASRLAQHARSTTELFARYYHHAAPFSRELLAEIWQRCDADPAQRDACLAAREQLAETLDALEIADPAGRPQ